MEIKAVSEHAYVIKKVNRKSQARYAKPYHVGDKITFSTTITRTTNHGDSGGNYVVRYKLYNNGMEIATITQNELVTLFQLFDVEIHKHNHNHNH